MPVVDSSVMVAAVKRNEASHLASRVWLSAMRDRGQVITAPVLLLPEVGGAVARATGRRQAARRLTDGLRTSAAVEILPITGVLADRAAAIAIDHGIRGSDAIFVALAEARGEALITLDREQLDRGRAVVAVYRPEEAPIG